MTARVAAWSRFDHDRGKRQGAVGSPIYVRHVFRLAVALGAVVALSGCTVPVVGAAGVGVDASGRPVGYLAVCSEHIDGATLYFEDPRSVEDRSVEVGEWTADRPVTSLASWPMGERAEGWTSRGPLPPLELGREYVMYGWTKDNSSSTGDVVFTVEQLRALEPGQVVYFDGFDEESQQDRYVTGSPGQFQTAACRNQ